MSVKNIISAIMPMLFLILLVVTGCKKASPIDGTNLSVTSDSINNLTQRTVSVFGNLRSPGASSLVALGFCYSTSPSPTLRDIRVNVTPAVGQFTYTITGLAPNTNYFVRTFAVNESDTAYGSELRFTTQALSLPIVSTAAGTVAKQISATAGGEVISDGGSGVTARGICWNTAPNPLITNSRLAVGAGLGVFTTAATGLSPNTTYYLRAYATNNTGTAYGNEISFTTQPIAVPGAGVTIDGVNYATVILGDKEWMAQNLRTTKYRNGDPIPEKRTSADWQAAGNASLGAWCWYDNNSGVDNNYGKLYNWFAISDPRNLAPEGWRVPTDGDWIVLRNYFGSTTAGGALKEAGTSRWAAPNTGATNISMFTALPGGFRYGTAGGGFNFTQFGTQAWFASSSSSTSSYSIFTLYYNNDNVQQNASSKPAAVSVRLVKD